MPLGDLDEIDPHRLPAALMAVHGDLKPRREFLPYRIDGQGIGQFRELELPWHARNIAQSTNEKSPPAEASGATILAMPGK